MSGQQNDGMTLMRTDEMAECVGTIEFLAPGTRARVGAIEVWLDPRGGVHLVGDHLGSRTGMAMTKDAALKVAELLLIAADGAGDQDGGGQRADGDGSSSVS